MKKKNLIFIRHSLRDLRWYLRGEITLDSFSRRWPPVIVSPVCWSRSSVSSPCWLWPPQLPTPGNPTITSTGGLTSSLLSTSDIRLFKYHLREFLGRGRAIALQLPLSLVTRTSDSDLLNELESNNNQFEVQHDISGIVQKKLLDFNFGWVYSFIVYLLQGSGNYHTFFNLYISIYNLL